MFGEYSHKKSESLAQIHTTMTKIQHFFLGDCFLLAHPVRSVLERSLHLVRLLGIPCRLSYATRLSHSTVLGIY